MPWDAIKLNDGNLIPSIAFGTWKLGNGQVSTDRVDQALSVGFSHIDTAQNYFNEAEAGIAIRESGLAREDIFITTKYSGSNGFNIETSIANSLKNLGVSHVDLYLIHHPLLAVPDIPTVWKQLEDVKAAGLAKSIGVSNFGVEDLKILLASAKVKPAANQILLHPYVYAKQKPIIEYCAANSIAIEAYSALIPITSLPGGPLDAPLNEIAERLGVTSDQVLLAWAKAKGTIVVTNSTKKSRLEGYLKAGELVLSDADITSLDKAGSKSRQFTARRFIRKLVVVSLVGGAALALSSYLGVDIL